MGELRHLGCAVRRRSSQHGALDAFESPCLMFAVGFAPTAEVGRMVHDTVVAIQQALAP